MTRGFAQANIARNFRFKNSLAKMTTHFRFDLAAQIIATVGHRQEDPPQGEFCIQPVANALHGFDHASKTFQGVVLTLQWNQDRIRGRQHIECQNSQ